MHTWQISSLFVIQLSTHTYTHTEKHTHTHTEKHTPFLNLCPPVWALWGSPPFLTPTLTQGLLYQDGRRGTAEMEKEKSSHAHTKRTNNFWCVLACLSLSSTTNPWCGNWGVLPSHGNIKGTNKAMVPQKKKPFLGEGAALWPLKRVETLPHRHSQCKFIIRVTAKEARREVKKETKEKENKKKGWEKKKKEKGKGNEGKENWKEQEKKEGKRNERKGKDRRIDERNVKSKKNRRDRKRKQKRQSNGQIMSHQLSSAWVFAINQKCWHSISDWLIANIPSWNHRNILQARSHGWTPNEAN